MKIIKFQSGGKNEKREARKLDKARKRVTSEHKEKYTARVAENNSSVVHNLISQFKGSAPQISNPSIDVSKTNDYISKRSEEVNIDSPQDGDRFSRMTFGQAFNAARKMGLKNFKFNNNLYTTELAEEKPKVKKEEVKKETKPDYVSGAIMSPRRPIPSYVGNTMGNPQGSIRNQFLNINPNFKSGLDFDEAVQYGEEIDEAVQYGEEITNRWNPFQSVIDSQTIMSPRRPIPSYVGNTMGNPQGSIRNQFLNINPNFKSVIDSQTKRLGSPIYQQGGLINKLQQGNRLYPRNSFQAPMIPFSENVDTHSYSPNPGDTVTVLQERRLHKPSKAFTKKGITTFMAPDGTIIDQNHSAYGRYVNKMGNARSMYNDYIESEGPKEYSNWNTIKDILNGMRNNFNQKYRLNKYQQGGSIDQVNDNEALFADFAIRLLSSLGVDENNIMLGDQINPEYENVVLEALGEVNSPEFWQAYAQDPDTVMSQYLSSKNTDDIEPFESQSDNPEDSENVDIELARKGTTLQRLRKYRTLPSLKK